MVGSGELAAHGGKVSDRAVMCRGLLMSGCVAAAAMGLGAQPASAATIFTGDLVVSSLTYEGTANPLVPGSTILPNSNGLTAIAGSSYPNVFNNSTPDGNFGVTAPYALTFFNTSGLDRTSIAYSSTYNINSASFTGSFPSKSEGAINVSANGTAITLAGYNAGVGQLDISNAQTPGSTETLNTDIAPATFRTVAQINSDGTTQFTNTNAYSGNNPRAVILGADGKYYMVGNAGNGKGDGNIATLTGTQIVTPGGSPATNTVQDGSYNITQNGFAADKSAKDSNFRGETIFNNTLYVTKGSGSNGINTVYQVAANGTTTILPGLPTFLAKTAPTTGQYQTYGFEPFGIWFANATTLYVADEGDGVIGHAAQDPNAGLEKWSFNGTSWVLDYTLQTGLGLGTNYQVCASPGTCYVDTATDGLRNITGRVNADGTVTIYGVTSTVSTAGDQGADPDKLMGIVDNLGYTTGAQASGESFATLETAAYGQVLRGVALVTPVPEPSSWGLMLMGFGGLGALLRSNRRRAASMA
jgi:hypothetical protein